MSQARSNILYALALWLVAGVAMVLAFRFFHGWESFVAGVIAGVGIAFGFVKIRS